MGLVEKESGLRQAPVWLPVVVCIVTAVFTGGGIYATTGLRLEGVEQRIKGIEDDRGRDLREFGQFKLDSLTAIQALRDNTAHMKETVDRIADKLGVLR